MFELLKFSEWIVFDFGDWKLKDDAPGEAKKAFEKFTENYKKNRGEGKIVE